jgi:hypothetical protein
MNLRRILLEGAQRGTASAIIFFIAPSPLVFFFRICKSICQISREVVLWFIGLEAQDVGILRNRTSLRNNVVYRKE